jgi:hypothetical protein
MSKFPCFINDSKVSIEEVRGLLDRQGQSGFPDAKSEIEILRTRIEEF